MSLLIDHPAGSGVPDLLLVLTPINWKKPPTIAYKLTTEIVEGLTGEESGAADHAFTRHRAEYSYLLDSDEAEELRLALKGRGATRIGVPVWPDEGRAEWVHAPQRIIAWDDDGSYIISDDRSDGDGYEHVAPLLIGQPGNLRVGRESPIVQLVTLTIEEDAPSDCRIDAGTDYPAMETWLLEANWIKSVKDDQRDRRRPVRLGQGREVGPDGDESAVRDGQAAQYSMDRSEVGALLQWWTARRGAAEAFAIPGLTGMYRFDGDVLNLVWETPTIIETQLRFWQQVDGSDTPARRTYLYEMQRGWETAVRWTSWERSLTLVSVGTFTPARIEHSGLRQTLTPLTDECRIDTYRAESGNPLMAIVEGEIELPIRVKIWECIPSAGTATAADLIYAGTVDGEKAVVTLGEKLSAQCTAFGGLFRRQFPAFAVQKACNYVLFSRPCGLLKADFEAEGNIISPLPGPEVTLENIPAQDEDYYADGWLEVTGTNGRAYARHITASVQDGDDCTVWLNRALPAVCAGQAAKIYPGCDGNASTCKEKFDNYTKFGGAPFVPDFISTSAGVAAGNKVK